MRSLCTCTCTIYPSRMRGDADPPTACGTMSNEHTQDACLCAREIRSARCPVQDGGVRSSWCVRVRHGGVGLPVSSSLSLSLSLCVSIYPSIHLCVCVCVFPPHGAGEKARASYSASTWCFFAKELRRFCERGDQVDSHINSLYKSPVKKKTPASQTENSRPLAPSLPPSKPFPRPPPRPRNHAAPSERSLPLLF